MIDFKTLRSISSEEAVAKRIRRHLSTAKGAYSVYIRYDDGLYKHEDEMGSLLPRLLSLPKTQATLDRIKESATEVLSNDDFINLIAVNIESDRRGQVKLQVKYTIPELENKESSVEIAI